MNTADYTNEHRRSRSHCADGHADLVFTVFIHQKSPSTTNGEKSSVLSEQNFYSTHREKSYFSLSDLFHYLNRIYHIYPIYLGSVKRKCTFQQVQNVHICSPLKHSKVSNNSVKGQQRPFSDCVDAEAYLGIRCPHMPEDVFSNSATHLNILSPYHTCLKI